MRHDLTFHVVWRGITRVGAFVALSLTFQHAAAQPLKDYRGSFTVIDASGSEFRWTEPTTAPEQRVAPSRSTASGMSVDAESHLAWMAMNGITPPSPIHSGSTPPLTAAAALEQATQRVSQHASASAPTDLIYVVLDVDDMPFPELASMRTMDDDEREAVFAERRTQMTGTQRSLVGHLASLGASTEPPAGVLNRVHARIPAAVMDEALAHPDVRAVYPAWPRVIPLYDGEEVRQQTFLSEYWNDGIRGDSGGNVFTADGGDSIKIAVVEPLFAAPLLVPNFFNTTHPGWNKWMPPVGCGAGYWRSRVLSNDRCSTDDDICSPYEDPENRGLHATWVASMVAGDLTVGQDPNITDPLEQARRSGVAAESSLRVLRAVDAGGLALAIDNAFLAGVDVINLSLGLLEDHEPCSMTANLAGLNELFRAVTEGGTLIVAAAGNEELQSQCPSNSICNVCYPAFRPEVVSVGNVHTPGNIDYDSALIHATSSRGWVHAGLGGQLASNHPWGVAISAVSISAPGTRSLYFASDDGYEQTERSGTSFAAPVVAAAAGLMRQELGADVADARMLRAAVLARGDGTPNTATSDGVTGGGSETYGTGKAKFHPFDLMQAPKGQAFRSFVLHEDEAVTIRPAGLSDLPSGVTQWKVGVYIDAVSLTAIPWISLLVLAPCESPDLFNWLDYDDSFNLERNVKIEEAASHPLADGCRELNVFGLSVPPEGVEIFVADYYHSGDPSMH